MNMTDFDIVKIYLLIKYNEFITIYIYKLGII